MKRKEIKDLNQKTIDELNKLVMETRLKLAKAKLERGSEKRKNIREIARMRDDLARLLTNLQEKQVQKEVAK